MEWRCIAQTAQQLAIPSVLALFLGGTFCTPVFLITGMSPLEKYHLLWSIKRQRDQSCNGVIGNQL